MTFDPTPKFTIIFTISVLIVSALIVFLYFKLMPETHEIKIQTETHIEYGPPQVERDR
jgi:hypothetical protein